MNDPLNIKLTDEDVKFQLPENHDYMVALLAERAKGKHFDEAKFEAAFYAARGEGEYFTEMPYFNIEVEEGVILPVFVSKKEINGLSEEQVRKIAYDRARRYNAIRRKVTKYRALTEPELKGIQDLHDRLVNEGKHILTDKGTVMNTDPVIIQSFDGHALSRTRSRVMNNQNPTNSNEIEAAKGLIQAYVDDSMIMFLQSNNVRLYLSVDGAAAVEVINGKLTTVYPKSKFQSGLNRIIEEVKRCWKGANGSK